MKLTEFLLDELDRETPLTRRVLERVPDGLFEWKPHEKSMPMGYLSMLVATMLGWIETMVNQPGLDFAPKGGSDYKPQELRTSKELVEALDGAVAKARAALSGTTDEHLMTTWKLLAGGVQLSKRPSGTRSSTRRVRGVSRSSSSRRNSVSFIASLLRYTLVKESEV